MTVSIHSPETIRVARAHGITDLQAYRMLNDREILVQRAWERRETVIRAERLLSVDLVLPKPFVPNIKWVVPDPIAPPAPRRNLLTRLLDYLLTPYERSDWNKY